MEFILFPLLSLLVYARSLRGPMIFDDYVLGSATERLHRRFWETYRPFAVFTHWLARRWPGTHRGERCLNVWLHAACGVVVMRIAGVLGLPDLLCGALFVAHPFAVNTVAYVTARASILSTLFGLLGVLAILSGWPVLAIPCLAASILSKEDGVGFAVLFAVLAPSLFVPLLLVGALLAFLPRPVYELKDGKRVVVGQRSKFAEYGMNNGDDIMRSIGLPVSHPQPAQGWTVFVETMIRVPLWMIGLTRSPYHGSGIPVSSSATFIGALLVAVVPAVMWWPSIPLAVLLLGPWLVYLLIRVPDQLMEYRNYSMTAGFALLLATLPLSIAASLLLAFAVYSFYESRIWSDARLLWERAAACCSGDSSRAHQEIGALLKLQAKDVEAEPYLREAVRRNPSLGPAVDNLAWILVGRGDAEGIRMMDDLNRRMPEYAIGPSEVASMTNHMGLCAFRTGSFALAKQWFSEAIQRRAEHVPYLYNRAVAMKVLGENADIEFQKLPRQIEGTREMIHPAEVPR